MVRRRARSTAAFTLVELMIVVAIMGVLAAIAIPAFTRYIKKARTAEAGGMLNKIWASSVAYYETDHMAGLPASLLPKQFPGPDAVAVATDCGCLTGGKCPVVVQDWLQEPWLSLHFAMPDPFNYVPAYSHAGMSFDSTFTADAYGDLDCDGLRATFRRSGLVNPNGDVVGQIVPIITNEFE